MSPALLAGRPQVAPSCVVSSPTPVAAIPRVEEIGETVVSKAGDVTHHRQPQHATEPDIARRAPPDFDRAVGTDIEPIVRIDAMEAPPHILDAGAEAGKRLRLE